MPRLVQIVAEASHDWRIFDSHTRTLCVRAFVCAAAPRTTKTWAF